MRDSISLTLRAGNRIHFGKKKNIIFISRLIANAIFLHCRCFNQ